MAIITVGSGIEFDHATIQSAIDAANPEDVIQIADGTYSNVVVDKAITLEAVGSDVTITGPGQANQAGIVIDQGVSAVTITGITVNATPGDLAAVYAVGANSDLNFSDNTLDGGVAGHAFLAGGSGGAGLSGSTFSNNTFQGDGAGGGSSSVVYINGLASLGVASSGNAFTDNIISGAPTGGLLMGIESSSSTITGNTFSGTASYAQLEVFGAGSTIGTNDFGADGPAFRDGTGTYDLAAIASDNGLTPAYAVGNAVFNDPADAAAAAGAAGTAMDLATGNFVVFEGMSIQAAVTAAGDGDTVEVGSGTFVLPSTLNVDKGITLLGQGEASTTIDASALINSYGISSHGDGADGVAFEGFTLNGPANLVGTAYGLKISDVDGVSVTDVTVQGSGRTEVDLNGVTNATLTNVTANGASLATGLATPGVGFAVSSSSDVTFTDIATDGLNDWGGVALFAGAGSYDLDVSGIVFNGSFDVTEPGMIYAQEKNGKTATIDTPPFAEVWTVQNDTFRDPLTDSEEYTFFFGSQAEAEAFATGLASPDRSVVRDPDGDLFVAEGMSIQTAVDEAMDGDTITVGAGDFSDEGPILLHDKSLTITGALAGETPVGDNWEGQPADSETVIDRFSLTGTGGLDLDGVRLLGTGPTSGNGLSAIQKFSSGDLTVSNSVLQIDGSAASSLSGSPAGIDVSGQNGDITVDNVLFTGFQVPDDSGAPHTEFPYGVYLNYGDTVTDRNVSVTDSHFDLGDEYANPTAIATDGRTGDEGSFIIQNNDFQDTAPRFAIGHFDFSGRLQDDVDNDQVGGPGPVDFSDVSGNTFTNTLGISSNTGVIDNRSGFVIETGTNTVDGVSYDALIADVTVSNDAVITTTPGDDFISGDDGLDTVIFTGNSSDYTILVNEDGTVTVTDTRVAPSDGSDTLLSVEALQFADGFFVAEGMSIQAAVDAASDGDTITVGAGTYQEQVLVEGFDGLTIVADGEVTLLAPADVEQNGVTGSGRAINAVVSVVDSEDVVLEGLTVDGDGRANTIDGPSANYLGVSYRNSSGGLEDVDITGVRDPYAGGTTVDGFDVVSGNQRGVGLQVDNDALMTFFMTGGSISDFQKNATVFNRADLNVTGVTVTGGGAQPIIAQNGFQALGSTGLISGNTVTNIGYAGPSAVSAGLILAFNNTDLDITDNILTGTNDVAPGSGILGVYVIGSGGQVSGGSVTGNTISEVDYGVLVLGDVTPNSVDVNNNTVTATDEAETLTGVYFQPTETFAVSHVVEGTDLDDLLAGGAANDILTGLDGDDMIVATGGSDVVDGGDGTDTYDVSAAGAGGAFVDLEAGTAFSTATGFDSLTGIERIIGSDGDDVVLGDAEDNTLVASGGNDNFNGRGGSDTYDASAAAAGLNVDLGGTVSGAFTATLSNVENVITGSGNDTVTGTSVDNRIETGAGDDVIMLAGGNDTVDGGDGMDRVVFTGNREAYDITWDGDTATVSDGTDTVTVSNAGQLGFADLTVLLVANGGDYGTIGAAVGAAVAGDELLLAEGTYAETVVVDKTLSIFGANAGMAHDDAGRGGESTVQGLIDVQADGVQLDGIAVQDGGSILGQSAGIYVRGDDLMVTNSVLDRAGAPDGHRGILTEIVGGDGLTVTASSFSGWATGVFANSYGTGTVTVTGNSFDGNTVGLSIDGPTAGSDVAGNSFANSGAEHIGVGVLNTQTGPVDVGGVVGENTFDASQTPVTLYALGTGQEITGTVNDDAFVGNSGDNSFEGGAGDDLLTGGSGNETIVLSGSVGDYTWAEAPGGFTITDTRPDSPDGTDTVTGVETVEFADATFATTALFAPIQILDENGIFAGGFTTIQDAVDASEAGYTIEVAAGTYDGDVIVDKAVTLIGSMEGVAFDDAARGTGETVIGGRVEITADAAVLNGFTLTKPSVSTDTGTGTNFTGWGGNNLTVAADNVTVSNTIVEAFGAHGGFSFGSGFVRLAGDGTSFEGNLVTAGAGYDAAIDARGVSGIWVTGADGDAIAVTGNRVEVSTDSADGIFVSSGDATVTGNMIDGTDGGFLAWDGYGNLVFTGNDISNVSAESIRILTSSLDPEVLVENNTFDNADPITFNLSGDSTVEGGAGDDIANAFASAAAVEFDGGDGADAFRPGMGGGLFLGGDGIDTLDLTGTTSDASVDLNAGTASSGEVGATVLSSVENATGGDGNDDMLGNADANMLVGGAGNDTLDGGAGDDTLDGGSGTDTVSHQAATQAIFVNLAAGTAFGAEIGTDTLIGIENVSTGSGNDVVFGSTGANVIASGAGDDLVYAGGDNDTILVGAGNNMVFGDAGDDTAILAGDWTSYMITDTGGGSFDISDGTFTSSFSSVENFTFDGETLAAGDLLNVAPDSLTFDDDTPTVTEDDAGAVVAEVFATDPNALDVLSYTVDDARFEVVDGGGSILLQLKAGDALTRLDDGLEVEVTVTDAGGLSLSEAVTIDIQNVNQPPGGATPLATWSPAAVEAGSRRANLAPEAGISDPDDDPLTYTYATALTAGSFYLGDTLVALGTELSEAEFETLTYMSPEAAGTYTAQFLVSDSEFDTPLTVSLDVTPGIDGTFAGIAGADLIDGAAGSDTIAAEAGNDTVYGGSGDDLIRGNTDNDLLFGDAGNDTMAGNDGDDTMSGGAGEDRMFGGTGDDNLNGDQGNDLVAGDLGNDTIRGGDGNDDLRGGRGVDILAGNSGDDTLDGGAGADVLIGGGGTDQMTGGAGADVFVFANVAQSPHGGARDTIVDFEVGIDTIDLTGFGGLTFTGATYTGAGNEVRYNDAIGRLYVDIDGDTASDFSVDLDGNPLLTVDDLLL